MSQLWAQAKYLYVKGESHWLENEEIKLQARSVEGYEKINPNEDLIHMFIEPGNEKDEFMNATEVLALFDARMAAMNKKMPQQQLYVNALGGYLIKCGFLRKHRNNKYGYFIK